MNGYVSEPLNLRLREGMKREGEGGRDVHEEEEEDAEEDGGRET